MRFKTNINCGGCVRGVTPALDGHKSIKRWKVDLESINRILTVHAEDEVSSAEISAGIADAGFIALPV
ncbi:hypothetical protein LEM8419_03458 [Neolewinella maritima]|uniref:Copper chaperone n=2 Tax=Neolewinella maritima TaxID=1383882 RepID=A0ABM9B5H2_9BACT|nr:hypothetical protein LEM8419_03458 [Neolewinella maritima]